ncbi:hypothetical protein BDZ89DRAFT_1073608 [Hymenopellis radicata]|nr:hypothetical protein BDZ89DRAFT_1073608 [Hymenopellis radicata]
MNNTSEFPQELLDEIVDWLHNDPSALIALASTAQCFRHRSQMHLCLPLLQTSPHILPYVRRLRMVAGEFPSASNARKRLYVHEDQSLGQIGRLHGPSSLLPIITSPIPPIPCSKSFSYFPSVISLRLLEVHAMSAGSPLDFQIPRITELSITAGLLSSPLGVSLLGNAADGWLACLPISRLIDRLPELTSLTLRSPVGDIGHKSSEL